MACDLPNRWLRAKPPDDEIRRMCCALFIKTLRLPMIITCPECETRYTVKAEAFKAPGRKVRCKECGNEWFQEPPEDEAAVPAPTGEAVPDPAPEPEPQPEPAPEPADEPAVVAAAAEPVPATEEPAPARKAKPSPGAETSAFTPAKKSRRGAIIGWSILVVFVGVFFGSLIAFRGDVAAYWPATAKLYDAIGFPVAVHHMEFRQVTFEETKENGLDVLSVRGEIINVTEERAPVPRVRLALRDAEGRELYHYFFAIPEGELDGGAVAEFVTRLSSPPAQASDFVLRFVEPGEYSGGETGSGAGS